MVCLGLLMPNARTRGDKGFPGSLGPPNTRVSAISSAQASLPRLLEDVLCTRDNNEIMETIRNIRATYCSCSYLRSSAQRNGPLRPERRQDTLHQ
jgi:hypothetical protein